MARTLTFEGLEIAYVVAALALSLELADEERDVERIGTLLDRSITGLKDQLAPSLLERIANIRISKGLPA
jgi:hypothetical protein